MKQTLLLIYLFFSLSAFSQNESLSNRLFKIQDDYLKIYLDGVYHIVYKECADYFMLCKIDSTMLEYTDTVIIYDIKERIRTKSFFKKSKLDGIYTSYYPNGEVETFGTYKNGLRVGEWKYYYDNGQLKKLIDFHDSDRFPSLLSFYNKKGKQLVTNGNGEFKDKFPYSISSSSLFLFSGKVKNGLLDGEWRVENNGTKICKEQFKNGIFLKGISFSMILGNTEYYENPISTFYEINYLENVKIWSSSFCKGEVPIGLSSQFYNELHSVLIKDFEKLPKRWYFVEIQTDNSWEV
jgi:hypothetical protein